MIVKSILQFEGKESIAIFIEDNKIVIEFKEGQKFFFKSSEIQQLISVLNQFSYSLMEIEHPAQRSIYPICNYNAPINVT